MQGDIVAIYNSSGTKVGTYTYDAWGNVTQTYLTTNNTDKHIVNSNPFRYRGYYYDTDTGFYYLQTRYYNPANGRFLNADTYLNANGDIIGFNMFAYCSNNPVISVDFYGTAFETVFDIISLGCSIVEVCVNPSDPWAWIGLAGDTLDLIPFATGIGETTRVVRVAYKATDTVDDIVDAAKIVDTTVDTIQIAKAVDFTEDAADIVKTLDRSSGFTKSTASAGRKIHQGYKATNNFSAKGKEFREIKGIRPDYIDFDTRTIYELKPMNPLGVRSGIRQLQRYNNALGGGFNLRLELY